MPFTPLNETDRSVSVTPLVTLCHASPPSVVRRIRPRSPTATPWLSLKKQTSYNAFVVPDVSGDHVAPASVLFRIVPVSPTTNPVPESRRMAPFKLLVVPESTGDHCPKTDEIKEKMSVIARYFALRLYIG